MSDGTTAETVAAALSCTRSNGDTPQPQGDEDGRLSELEIMFLNLVGTVEDLKDRQAEAGRRLASLELKRVAEGRVA